MFLDEEDCESEESESVEIAFLNDKGSLVMTNARDTVLSSTSADCEVGVIDFEADILLCSGTLEEVEKNPFGA